MTLVLRVPGKSFREAHEEWANFFGEDEKQVQAVKKRATDRGHSIHVCGKAAMAKRSSLPGSFTTLHSLLEVMVRRALVS